MENLGIDFRLIVVQIINFGLLLFLLTKFLYKPILKILDERKKRIAKSLADAQKIEEERVSLKEEKEKELKKAKDEAKEIVSEAKSEAEKERSEILKRVQEETERMVQKAKEQLILEKEKVRQALKTEAVDLALAMAEKLLEEKLARVQQKELMRQSLGLLKKGLRPSDLFQAPLFERKKTSPQAGKIALEILTLLKKTQNLKLLPQILEKLESQMLESAEIITAALLKPEEEQKVRQTLEEIFGGNIKIKFRVNPKIVGGMVVRVGDQVFDSSLLGKARQLRESI